MSDTGLTLFDNWIHETYAGGKNSIGPVVLVRSDEEFSEFREWVESHDRPLAYDIETNGLARYRSDWKIKSIQWGDTKKAYVFLWAEPWFQRSIDLVMSKGHRLLAHNASFDALGLARFDHVDHEAMLKRTHDTMVLAHLCDPRPRGVGDSVGLKLKDLAQHHVDASAPDSDKALKAVFKQQGWNVEDGWYNIPADHPTLVEYAGVDVMITALLYEKLKLQIKSKNAGRLVSYEHELLRLCASLEHRGMLLDVPYAEELAKTYNSEINKLALEAASLGVKDVYKTKQVAQGLESLGANLIEFTPTGDVQVNEGVLTGVMEDNSAPEDARRLAGLILDIKRRSKRRDAYVLSSLDLRDSNDRVHPGIRSLAARTARMSVNTPPLHQLPSGESALRSLYLAEPGHRAVSVDFSGVELRVMAALSQDKVMLKAFLNGDDLHQMTADSAGVERSVGKTVNFGKTYGGGAETLAKQANISEERAKDVMRGFDDTYPGVSKYGRRLGDPIKSGSRDYVISATGRFLPVEPNLSYRALNYMIQSTARDVLGRAMINLEKNGLWQYAMLPIHDEILYSFPAKDARELSIEAAITMEMAMDGVHISSEAEIGEQSWGSLYTEGKHHEIEITMDDRRKYGSEQLIISLESLGLL